MTDSQKLIAQYVRKNYTTNHSGQFPSSFDQLTASGALGTTNFPGKLSLNDFEFCKDGMFEPGGGKPILRLRNLIQKPGGGAVTITGGLDDQGVCHTTTWNVSD